MKQETEHRTKTQKTRTHALCVRALHDFYTYENNCKIKTFLLWLKYIHINQHKVFGVHVQRKYYNA